MELLDRYLNAIEFWLPKRQRQDIIAELSEDLRSQIEEKETELGRKLNDTEVEAILKRCGAPLVVASRYLPQQYLVGPVLFPVYRFVLAIVVAGCVIPRLLVWIGFLLVDPAHRGHLHLENLWTTVVFFAFSTTLIFAIIERSDVKSKILDSWNPRKLPPVRDPNRISRLSTLFEIAAVVVFIVWFVSTLYPRPVIDFYGLQLTLAPTWNTLFGSYVFLSAFNLAIASANLFRPYWTTLRASLRLLSDVIGGALFCWLLKAQVLVAISTPSLSSAKAAGLTNVINLLMARALPWAIVVLVVVFCFGAYRIVRVRGAHPNGGSFGPAVKDLSNPMVNGN